MKKLDNVLTNKPADTRAIPRRGFLKSAAAVGAGLTILRGGVLRGAGAPSNKLNVGLIGTWGRAQAHFGPISSENVVALCDVDENHLAFGASTSPRPRSTSTGESAWTRRTWTR